MDEKLWALVIWTLAASVFVVSLDAVLRSFELGPGFWAVPTGIIAFATAWATAQSRRDK